MGTQTQSWSRVSSNDTRNMWINVDADFTIWDGIIYRGLMVLHYDRTSGLQIAINLVFHERKKHFGVDI